MVKPVPSPKASCLDRPNGQKIWNVTEQLGLLHDAWWGIFNSYPREQAPAWGPFWGRYRAHVKEGLLMQMSKISAQQLHDTLHATPDVKACGLDAWTVVRLKKLPSCWWERFADVLDLIEEGKPWPQPLLPGYVSFIGKGT